ncbi:MAG: hypothetical protein KBC21_03230 [Candidatus Pacebacteria bacterium]|nr:hypothetical protein [Candidatus Paceibacterota bacterium]
MPKKPISSDPAAERFVQGIIATASPPSAPPPKNRRPIIIAPIPINVLPPRQEQKPSGGDDWMNLFNQAPSVEEKGNTVPDAFKNSIFLKILLGVGVLVLYFFFMKYSSDVSLDAGERYTRLRSQNVTVEAGEITNAERRAALERQQSAPFVVPTSPGTVRPQDVPDSQRNRSFPVLTTVPCTSGAPSERGSEGYNSPQILSGGFEVGVGCAWIVAPFVSYNMQTWGQVRMEHPESNQVCKTATDCIRMLNDVHLRANDKRVRVSVFINGQIKHWGPKIN